MAVTGNAHGYTALVFSCPARAFLPTEAAEWLFVTKPIDPDALAELLLSQMKKAEP